MTVILDRGYGMDEAGALAELERGGFVGAVKDYAPGITEPHRHDYDIQLYVLDGEFRVTEVEADMIHVCQPGDRLFVGAGTPHFEDHGELRMVVGRRDPNG